MTLQEALPLIIPIIILEWTLAIVALIHVLKHPHYQFGNKPMWIIVVLFIQIIGPVVYFIFGRGRDI
ncbi:MULTISPECIES: PLD nuclease N-terminal domain-containing protein [Rummeliibacillus]|jgi:hypothetical protein|uniref:PLD nuclease N-terminal domain-containing protein n=1 Tax=Rummeliibacillus TaxID=648802 RepID=UPI001646C687|nr:MULTISPECIES: PLD nuclease N-terminal domain-containing protein [Rummeliibacillus]MBO2535892.1 PLDc_N domain-containing protein [Rummeliibacillus suwonensis]